MAVRWGFLSAVVVALLAYSGLAARQKTESGPSALEQTARSFVELLNKGEFARATQDFDAVMLKALPADELKKTWEKVIAQAGAYKKQVGSRLDRSGKYEIVYVTCEFTQMQQDARVVFDKAGKITGLFFGPVQKLKPQGAEEIYEGTLKVGSGVELRLAFHLFKQKDGSYLGTMDSPDQGVSGIALDDVRVQDDTVRLELKSAKMVYEGKRGKDGQEITGELKQAGMTLPLVLKKVDKVRQSRRPQTPKPPFPYDAVEVAYDNKKGDVHLAGTLTVPRTGGPFPAVLLITGSGPQDRDETIFGHKPFLVLADYLTRRGIAVLRVDDRGVGGSTGNTRDATSADFADDVQAGVEFLKNRKEINASRIGLIGHSEGGIIAPLVASRTRDVAFIVLLAGTGVPGDEILYKQAADILKLSGADAEKMAQQKKLQERMFAVLRKVKDKAAAEAQLRAAVAELAPKKGDKGEKSEVVEAQPLLEGQIQMALTPWFRHFLDYDPRPALRKVACPVLALNGEKDVQVDARINLKAIEAALREAGNKDVIVRELPSLNHLFQTCKTGGVSEYGNIEETLAPVVLETIATWILQHTGRQAAP
jgi:pimeloyl-ACP methyl ester carboxylesterase